MFTKHCLTSLRLVAQTQFIPTPGVDIPAMAGSISTSSELAKVFESLSANDDNGSSAQQALSSLLGFEVPLDESWDTAIDKFATKLGLTQADSTLVSPAIFVVTKAAILEGAELIGIGGGLAKLDLAGFQMARLIRKVEEINQKLDVVLDTPLREAEKYLREALIQLDEGYFAKAIDAMKEVKTKATTAFEYKQGMGANTETLNKAVKATQLKVFSELAIQSYDGTKITPFPLLERRRKKVISSFFETYIEDVISFFNSHEYGMLHSYNPLKSSNEKTKQDTLDLLLKASYPYISEGNSLTNMQADVKLPLDLKVQPKFLAGGEEDFACVIVGQHMGKRLTAKVWKEGGMAKGCLATDDREGQVDQIEYRSGREVTLHLQGWFISS